jgi:hypothetical protein
VVTLAKVIDLQVREAATLALRDRKLGLISKVRILLDIRHVSRRFMGLENIPTAPPHPVTQ